MSLGEKGEQLEELQEENARVNDKRKRAVATAEKSRRSRRGRSQFRRSQNYCRNLGNRERGRYRCGSVWTWNSNNTRPHGSNDVDVCTHRLAPTDLHLPTCTRRLVPTDLCPPHVLSPVIDLESKATDSDFVKHVTELFQVQAKAVVAQTAVQHLPSLKPFTGERGDKDENFH